MHVIIPVSWLNHPFASGSFEIKSSDQIQKIIKSGFGEVRIDTEKEVAVIEPKLADHGDKKVASEPKWQPGELVPPALFEAIHDKDLAPEKRADVVYKSSVERMGKLLDDPKAENIMEAK